MVCPAKTVNPISRFNPLAALRNEGSFFEPNMARDE